MERENGERDRERMERECVWFSRKVGRVGSKAFKTTNIGTLECLGKP